MKTKSIGATLGALLVCAAASASDPSPTAVQGPDVKRGDYLVNRLLQCSDCHTPRNEKGEYVREAWLMGAPILFKPTVPMPVWAEAALPIAGLPTFAKDDDAVRFLMTGLRPDGTRSKPPMPHYEFNEADALDAVAYLRSLAPKRSAAKLPVEPGR